MTGVEPAFGAYPPSPQQAKIIARFNGTLLGGTSLRRQGFKAFMADRPGPIDSSLFGYKVRFYPHDNSPDMKALICGAKFNRRELRWLAAGLPEGGTFVDIGANFGFFTLAAARRGARICSIEPNPELFRRFELNLSMNGLQDSVVRFRFGAGPSVGTARLSHAGDAAGASIVGDGAHSHDVEMRPLLDMMIEAGLSRIDMLKIDIEGFEDQALLPFFATAPKSLWPQSLLMEDSCSDRWSGDLLGECDRLGYRKVARSRGNMWLRRPAE